MVSLPLLCGVAEADWDIDRLQRNLPPESSQYGTLRPTKLDKIKNFWDYLHPSVIITQPF